ncbi:integrase [Neobacillus ginsengisoli]|uniref:Integrase n=1 Tax=Neobacillus ginsengisoli TaxID=904295 RepID=A0ABT9XZV7_9BACI|nr:integrase [Neobacillus ginsengisoli]
MVSANGPLQQGVHPKVVSEHLGHSTIGITMDTYTHVLPNMQKEAAQQFESLKNNIFKVVSFITTINIATLDSPGH